MKFMHLSDLHIGKTIAGISMLEEQRHVFGQVKEYIKELSPQAVVIAGDVYDRTIPGIEAVNLFDDLITDLSGMNVDVMIVSGNHDSSERLNYASRLLTEKGVYLCGVFDGKLHRVTLEDCYGEINFWLLPFIKPSSLYGMYPDKEINEYKDAVAAALESGNIDCSARNVLISHQFYSGRGQVPVRSESELDPIGGLDAVDASVLEGFDYVALGHLHGCQAVGDERIRYAGSPLKYSFSECGHKKGALMVEMRRKGDLKVTQLSLTPIHDMREIRGDLESLTNKNIVAENNNEDYIRAVLTDEDDIIDPMGKLKSVYPNIMNMLFDNTRSRVDFSEISPESDNLERLTPAELFAEFCLDVYGLPPDEEEMKIVNRLLEEGDYI